MIIILTGVSCSGKSTQSNILINKYNFKNLISYTSREPRKEEINGVHYKFISKNDFQNKINNGFFIEYTKKFDNYYGTAIEDIKYIKDYKNIVMCLCPLGYCAIKKIFPNYVIGIYLLPPNKNTLLKRFTDRNTNKKEIERRIDSIFEISKQESKLFNNILENDSIENISSKILKIAKINV